MLSRIFMRNMSYQSATNILKNTEAAEKRLIELKRQLEEVKQIRVEKKIQELTSENNNLVTEIKKALNVLVKLEVLNGKKQYTVPGKTENVSAATEAPTNNDIQENITPPPKKEKKEKEMKKLKDKSGTVAAASVDTIIDVRKLDFRIGKIIDINKHPDADSLYVEKIDCGEENPRTVVSGLVNHVPIDEMRDRVVMVLCNLKPVKMRGVTSEAMVMCASSPDKVEVLIPPKDAIPGDLVFCEGYPREPEVQLNPKKKIFETCAPDLKTNDNKVACYKDSPLVVPGKGPIVAQTLKEVSVK